MLHLVSNNDLEFKQQVETCAFSASDFDHRAHVRLAYIYLCNNTAEESVILMRETLMGLLKSVGVDPVEKYHQTLTEAWILAVNHFMQKSQKANSADEFIDNNSALLDSNIMLKHYSAETLFSDNARFAFVEPDIQIIPR